MKVKDIMEKIDQSEIPVLIAALEEKASSTLKESFPNGFLAITQNQYFEKKGGRDSLDDTGVFKAVVRDKKIDVPEVEMDTLELSEGDVVMCMIRKIEKG